MRTTTFCNKIFRTASITFSIFQASVTWTHRKSWVSEKRHGRLRYIAKLRSNTVCWLNQLLVLLTVPSKCHFWITRQSFVRMAYPPLCKVHIYLLWRNRWHLTNSSSNNLITRSMYCVIVQVWNQLSACVLKYSLLASTRGVSNNVLYSCNEKITNWRRNTDIRWNQMCKQIATSILFRFLNLFTATNDSITPLTTSALTRWLLFILSWLMHSNMADTKLDCNGSIIFFFQISKPKYKIKTIIVQLD